MSTAEKGLPDHTPALEADLVPELEAAMSRAGRLLTLRARTESEVVDRLARAGYEKPVVAEAVARLKRLRLIDDVAFAREWVEERMRRKGAGPAVLRRELLAKGIDDTTADEVIAQALPDEVTRATEVAAGLVARMGDLALAKQAARLSGGLARRGFSQEAVEAALTAVLPPEGWDY